MRAIGKGRVGAELFCGIRNLPAPTSKFEPIVKILGATTKKVCQQSMTNAVEEAVRENESRDIAAAFDGTWQKRGHKSLNGVVTATNVNTGRVIDVEILSKYCKCYNNEDDGHEDDCSANYSGPSGGMEIEGVKRIFKRSNSLYNIHYKSYLGDGDSKAYQSVVDAQPYGPDFDIEKLECINHVLKRMGSRLRKLKTILGGVILSDGKTIGKTIGGRNRLTDATINKIQQYYGLAICNNAGNVEQMRKAVWTVYFHLSSSNLRPLHGLCPSGVDSWCKYKKAITSGSEYDHEKHHHLPEAIMNELKDIFKDLANVDLLKKCMHSNTQNLNESVNNVIWTRIPKRVFIQLRTLRFGVHEAISCYNQVNVTKCFILREVNIKPGRNCIAIMKKKDISRIDEAEAVIPNVRKMAMQPKSKTHDDSYLAGHY